MSFKRSACTPEPRLLLGFQCRELIFKPKTWQQEPCSGLLQVCVSVTGLCWPDFRAPVLAVFHNAFPLSHVCRIRTVYSLSGRRFHCVSVVSICKKKKKDWADCRTSSNLQQWSKYYYRAIVVLIVPCGIAWYIYMSAVLNTRPSRGWCPSSLSAHQCVSAPTATGFDPN